MHMFLKEQSVFGLVVSGFACKIIFTVHKTESSNYAVVRCLTY